MLPVLEHELKSGQLEVPSSLEDTCRLSSPSLNMSVKQNIIIISALTCSGKSALARVPDHLDATTPTTTTSKASNVVQQQQFRTYTGPTVGEFRNKPGKKPLYVHNETKVRLLHGYEILDLDPAPYRLPAPDSEAITTTTTTHDFARYRADILKLTNATANGNEGRVILVSTHDATREFLCRGEGQGGGWRYWLVYPAQSLREAWVQRHRDRDAGNPDRTKIEKFARALDERFEMFVEGIVRGLPIENGATNGSGEGRSSFVAANGCVKAVGGGGGDDDDSSVGTSSSSNVQWLEIQDAKMGLEEVVAFIIAQQKRQA